LQPLPPGLLQAPFRRADVMLAQGSLGRQFLTLREHVDTVVAAIVGTSAARLVLWRDQAMVLRACKMRVGV